ncbi:MAG: hypothetical protein NE334_20975 [Lentisphaeraceae bacterium]|nr:hypothetical protein [Lentisphaeraceae bacterium]
MKSILSVALTVLFLTMTTSYAEEGKKKKRGPSPEMREKLKNMSDAERQAFKAEMKAKRQANGEVGEGKKGKYKKGKKKDSAES